MNAEYRIEYSIQRMRDGDDDFTEIGFGSTGGWDDLEGCTHWLDSAVANYEWETTGDMPQPDEIKSAIRAER